MIAWFKAVPKIEVVVETTTEAQGVFEKSSSRRKFDEAVITSPVGLVNKGYSRSEPVIFLGMIFVGL